MDRRNAMKAFGLTATGVIAGQAAGKALGDEHEHGESHGEHAEHNGHGSQNAPMPPVENVHLYFCGFHIAKNNPSFQIETQHYCAVQGEEMHQCILYDTNEKTAKLLGVEYIVSDKLFRGLPQEEKKYWHPHTYEVLGGQLIAPHMDREGEDAFMKALITTWGKAIHVWPDPSTKLPIGDPLLMWSITGAGQIDPDLLASRDKRFNVDTEATSARRQQQFDLPEPSIALPKNIDVIGRQWTNNGPDTPGARRTQIEGGK